MSRVDIFDRKGSIGPTLASVTSSFLNTVCIMVMGKVCVDYIFQFHLKIMTYALGRTMYGHHGLGRVFLNVDGQKVDVFRR